MNKMSTQPIIVGVSEPGASEGALRFAVDEASRQRCALTIVHALSDSVTAPLSEMHADFSRYTENSPQDVDRSSAAEAYRLVTDIARRARVMGHGLVRVDTDVPVGHRVHALVEAAENARLVILQHRDLPMIERIFVRSASVGVTARAHCPVVTVPHDWKPNVHHNRVTAGIDDLEGSADVLHIAFESALRRRATLQIVHAGGLMSIEGAIALSDTQSQHWQSQAEQALAELLLPWQRHFPTVKVVQIVVQTGAIQSLLEYSKDSDLLVLGRLRVRLPLPLPLGAIARAMVNEANCPVEIVPHFVGSGARMPVDSAGRSHALFDHGLFDQSLFDQERRAVR